MNDASLRKHLIELLRGGHAHTSFEDVVAGFPVEMAGIRPDGSPHSAWELLEHIRIALHDIVLFSGILDESPRSSSPPNGYVELKWPDDYWPKSRAPRTDEEWRASLKEVASDTAAVIHLLEDDKRDLFEPFPWGQGQTLLREILLIADHSAWHAGQLMLLRRMVEAR
jgi:hypothetical protein